MTPNHPTDPTDQRDFGALLDEYGQLREDLGYAIRAGDGALQDSACANSNEARAAVVAEYERVWDKRVKAMLERATLSVENKRLAAELAAAKADAEQWKEHYNVAEKRSDKQALTLIDLHCELAAERNERHVVFIDGLSYDVDDLLRMYNAERAARAELEKAKNG